MSSLRVSEEIVEKAWAIGVKEVSGAAQPHPYRGPWDKPALRAALEAVWPEPTFTPEEVGALLIRLRYTPLPGVVAPGLVSAIGKLEAMRDAQS